ncbi:MAG: phosphoenolpyruvate-protein phosphotransferase [Pseudohongiellaceae bacterium]|jgi:phosphotransferase system enzyme I (PtsI)/phosphotransferase system enzyme I (PtsP)
MKNVILQLTNIVQNASLIEVRDEQITYIVDSICKAINVDVCSVYVVAQDKAMELVASHGLVNNHKVRIPDLNGIVGQVVKTRHAINTANARSHPSYYHIEGIEEDRYSSFCGVPVVRYGTVIGVLAVQRITAQKLSDEDEAFVSTLASQLSHLIQHRPAQSERNANLRLEGIRGAPGIGIGNALLCENNDLFSAADTKCTNAETTIAQWHLLLDKVRAELKEEQQALSGRISGSVSGIFDAYLLLLADNTFISRVETEIRAGHGLPTAMRLSVRYFSEMFKAMDDPYLQARHEDIRHLGNKLYDTFKGGAEPEKTDPQSTAIVLVGNHISASDIASVEKGKLAGIISTEGSSLSHVAVLANALGIPAVMGLDEVNSFEAGELVIVDGYEGQVVLRPQPELLAEYDALITQNVSLSNRLAELRNQPAITLDGTWITLFTNTGLLADISPGLENGAQGIGLYRTEIPFMIRESLPTEEEQYRVYKKVFDAYTDKPVYMRTLDIGGDKQLPYLPILGEENPALGWRGIRFSLDNVQLQMTQVRAMIRASGSGSNLSILLPMVSSSDELDIFTSLLDDACQQLIDEGLTIQRPRLGIMVEVPAAITQLHFWADKIDFISIGSNDLSQYLLALDRNNKRVAARYDHIHPAVLSEINRVVGIAKQYKLPLSLCGEMASDPEAVLILLGMGIRTLSMSANKLPRIKWLIRSLTMEQAKAVAAQALTLDKVSDIRSLTHAKLSELGLTELLH